MGAWGSQCKRSFGGILPGKGAEGNPLWKCCWRWRSLPAAGKGLLALVEVQLCVVKHLTRVCSPSGAILPLGNDFSSLNFISTGNFSQEPCKHSNYLVMQRAILFFFLVYGGDEQSLNYCLIIAKCTWKPELLCVAILKTQDLILQLRQLTSPTVLHQVCWAGILCLWSILVPFCEDRKSPVLHCPGQAESRDPALTLHGPGVPWTLPKSLQGGGHRAPVALSSRCCCAREAQTLSHPRQGTRKPIPIPQGGFRSIPWP